MRAVLIVATLFLATSALADGGSWYTRSATYVGASALLNNGLAGASELGFAVQVAPFRHFEFEAGAFRHDVDGNPFGNGPDAHDTWVYTAATRAKLHLRYAAIFAGLGFMVGDHGVSEGCSATGINFCSGANGTLVYRHYHKAVWLTPEFGAEVGGGPVALRMAIAPLALLSKPDVEEGCLACSDGESGLLFTMGLHFRFNLGG